MAVPFDRAEIGRGRNTVARHKSPAGLSDAIVRAWLRLENRLTRGPREFAALPDDPVLPAADGALVVDRAVAAASQLAIPLAATVAAPAANANRLPQMLAVALALALTLQVADMRHALPVRRTVEPVPSGPQPVVPADLVQRIVRAHLFGEAPPSILSGASTATLLLSGVVALGDPHRGLAIVAADGGRAHVYTVGGELPGGTTLLEVYGDHVIVGRSGVQWQLTLPRLLSSGAQYLAATATGPEPDAPLPVPDAAGAPDFQQRALLSALSPASGAARTLRPQAVVADGKLHGYQVYPTDPDKLGVQSGDELVAINDRKLDDPAEAAHLMEGLDSSQATSVKLTLMHQGQTYDLVVGAEALRWHRR